MLSKPIHGWTNFSLGESTYALSYLTNVPVQWLDEAIHGLKTLRPFVVHGFCEPGRMICTVSYWNCHIVLEDDERAELSAEDTFWEIAHISMPDFCRQLHRDISENMDDWCGWISRHVRSCEQREMQAIRQELQTKLDTLQKLIDIKESDFDEDHCFL